MIHETTATEFYTIGIFDYLDDTVTLEETLSESSTEAKQRINETISAYIVNEFKKEPREENLYNLNENFDFSDKVISSQVLPNGNSLIFDKSERTIDIYLRKQAGFFIRSDSLTHLYKFFISKQISKEVVKDEDTLSDEQLRLINNFAFLTSK